MNALNNFKNSLSAGAQGIQDLYQYRPPNYDIACGICRIGAIYSINALMLIAGESRVLPHLIPLIISTGVAMLEIPSLIRSSRLNKIADDQSKKDVVLICRATSDLTGGANKLSSKEFEIFKKLAQTCSIVSKQVDTVADINNAIDKIHRQGKKIKTLYFKMHGCPYAIAPGKEHIVTVEDDKIQNVCVDKISFEKLDPEADIILMACNVGKDVPIGRLNIADYFQLCAGPHRRVSAPKAAIASNGINQIVNPNSKFDYRFKDLSGNDITSDISYPKVVEKRRKNRDYIKQISLSTPPSSFSCIDRIRLILEVYRESMPPIVLNPYSLVNNIRSIFI